MKIKRGAIREEREFRLESSVIGEDDGLGKEPSVKGED